jgi:GTP cyclohydrolase II
MVPNHIILTSHPETVITAAPTLRWGAKTAKERGPVIATLTHRAHRNTIGTHSGSYAVYRALAMASQVLDPGHRPDFAMTSPVTNIGPHPAWFNAEKIVSLDPFGAIVYEAFRDHFARGFDIRPTIAITKAHVHIPELQAAIDQERIKVDNNIVKENNEIVVTKAAIDPVWYLPGIAKRFGISEADLRRTLFEQTGGMFPELVTRADLKVLLPPVGSTTVYIFGNVGDIADPTKELTVRVHDECNGSDVFGSDICTCRPYLVYGIEEGVRTAQRGGTGIIVYFRKEGRSLGEVTKFLVYNARKRQEGGDTAEKYFERTECVAGVQDMRFQELMPDVLHWLGIQKIDQLVSMSDMKYNAIIKSGIDVRKRISIPDSLIPKDAWVEMNAKRAAGYYNDDPTEGAKQKRGRKLDE